MDTIELKIMFSLPALLMVVNGIGIAGSILCYTLMWPTFSQRWNKKTSRNIRWVSATIIGLITLSYTSLLGYRSGTGLPIRDVHFTNTGAFSVIGEPATYQDRYYFFAHDVVANRIVALSFKESPPRDFAPYYERPALNPESISNIFTP